MAEDNDKTRRAPPQKNRQTTDATRIAPARPTASEVRDDHTRIQPSRPPAAPDRTRLAAQKEPADQPTTDRTRVAPNVHQPRVSADTTRLAPAARKPPADQDRTRVAASGKPSTPEKTRVAPRRLASEFPDRLEDQEDITQPQVHEVLKKRFVLEEVLGAGGMGVVYKARDLLKVEAQDRDPYVAIKVLSEEFKSHPEAFISLQRESRKSQRIAHPNIVNVHDFDRDGDTVFMTMEYLEGSPLDELINRYKSTGLPTDDVWEIVRGMASALAHAHAEQIIHSDFKPGNVFVTSKGVAKVFDFGIARAVAQVEHLDHNPDDRTLFDAGSLGALTPAYASLEMLQGEEPDVRDDIYALGCVTYEMLTGQHPFNKVPADEAERQGMKPKRISHIKSYQWKAIEKALAFKREERSASIDEFITALSPSLGAGNRWLVALLIVVSSAVAAYYLYLQQQPAAPEFSEEEFLTGLELKVRIDFYKETIATQLENPDFSDAWQESLWKNMENLVRLTRGEDSWVDDRRGLIYQLYLDRIRSAVDSTAYAEARSLIANARRYTSDESELDGISSAIAQAVEEQVKRREQAARQQAQEKQARLEREKQQAEKQQAQQEAQARAAQQTRQFDVALENLNGQLRCQSGLNMRNVETAVNKLKQLDANRFAGQQDKIVGALARCIESIGVAFPARAQEAQRLAMRMFPTQPRLGAIVIKSRDPCDTSLAGLGSRGKRAVCKDKLKVAGSGPELVVIPASSRLAAFAIGKYEVSVGELNLFCRQSPICKPIENVDAELPVSAIDINVAGAYLDWLSEQTGQVYRLPSKQEWVYAARSRRKELDPNRNCELSTRGFEKGGELVKIGVGRQNSWGLVNYVGNVQEWVYDAGRKLTAVGGSYRQAMEECDITTSYPHNGAADPVTGLRVVREIREVS